MDSGKQLGHHKNTSAVATAEEEKYGMLYCRAQVLTKTEALKLVNTVRYLSSVLLLGLHIQTSTYTYINTKYKQTKSVADDATAQSASPLLKQAQRRLKIPGSCRL